MLSANWKACHCRDGSWEKAYQEMMYFDCQLERFPACKTLHNRKIRDYSEIQNQFLKFRVETAYFSQQFMWQSNTSGQQEQQEVETAVTSHVQSKPEKMELIHNYLSLVCAHLDVLTLKQITMSSLRIAAAHSGLGFPP